MQTGTSTNNMNWMDFAPESTTELERVFPCRCGTTHRGEHAEEIYKQHSCFHKKLAVIDQTPTGDFLVACSECETAWIAPVHAEGVSVSFSESGMANGCGYCRDFVMEALKEHPDSFDYTCPECKYEWRLTKRSE